MIKRFIIGVFIAVIMIAVHPKIMALEDKGVGFSVKALLPDNQISKDKTYFDLAMQPGQEQTIEVEVFNSSTEAIEISAEINTATTNINGIIDYSDTINQDESLLYAITDIAKLESTDVVLQANSSVKLPIHIKMPEEQFDGILLGGIKITKNIKEDQEQENNVTIKNQYAYIIGLSLSETSTEIVPDLHLKYIKPTLINGYTAIVTNIQNDKSIDVQNLKIDAKIYKADSDTVLYSSNKENISMAPNSNFDFAIGWKESKIVAGKYRLHMIASNEQGYWEWDEEYTIQAQEAEDINDGAVSVDNEKDCVVYYLVFIILFLLIVIFVRKRKKDYKRRD